VRELESTRPMAIGPAIIRAQVEDWPLSAPFRTAAHTVESATVLLVSIERDGCVGFGEAAGVYYRHDGPSQMLADIEVLRSRLPAAISRDALQEILPAGGARNALDCALWDLEAKLSGSPAWEAAQLLQPRALLTTFTCGADEPTQMAATARAYEGARAIKLKLTGEAVDADRVRAVREALPHVWLGVDANQGFNRSALVRLMPDLVKAAVKLIEQPFPRGEDVLLDGFQSPIPIAADESVQGLADVAGLVGRFNVVNIKLDKCGGLTEALTMARRARSLGLDCMVGNMLGTSLAMAPAYLVGQLCQMVDLDGPVFLKGDRALAVEYIDGYVCCPDGLWGNSHRTAASAMESKERRC
jgi:L-Ala-D/L-Glu epimerase